SPGIVLTHTRRDRENKLTHSPATDSTTDKNVNGSPGFWDTWILAHLCQPLNWIDPLPSGSLYL
ncbi:hypothetical protein QM333_35830, partial [Pseudomonas aeruginosa]